METRARDLLEQSLHLYGTKAGGAAGGGERTIGGGDDVSRPGQRGDRSGVGMAPLGPNASGRDHLESFRAAREEGM